MQRKNRLHDYLTKFPEVITELSKRSGKNEAEVLDILDHFFVTLKKWITDPRMPTIRITNFGTFKPSIGKITWHIKRSIGYFRKNVIDRKTMAYRIKRVWRIRERLMKEKHGVETWYDWRDKKLDPLRIPLIDLVEEQYQNEKKKKEGGTK